ncbi:hypothetical protein [Sphingobacterium siyangense]|uniref:hypothetical protein n=1 Tax=Sphingobacterium siyangense TaxID=459529 RepID=UPI002FDA9A7C
MAEKVIIRSLTVDKHGDFVPLKMMEAYVLVVNGENKMRYLANHRRDLPPLGYWDNAEIKVIGYVHNTLAEPIRFKNRSFPDWEKDLIMEDAGGPISFLAHKEKINDVHISVDKNNFKKDNLEIFENHFSKTYNETVELDLHLRKGILPDPEVIITLAKYWLIFYPFVQPLLTKMGEKIAEDIGDDMYQSAKSNLKKMVTNFKSTVKLAREKMIPHNRVLLTIFEIPGDPYIELHIKSDDPKKIEIGLSTKKLAKVHKRISEFSEKLEVEEIYFNLNEKDKWSFSYLITKDGKVLGTKSVFKKRDKLVNRIELSNSRGFSLGAGGVKFEEKPPMEG